MTVVSEFISKVKSIHATGNATEHSYRSAFEKLFSDLGATALNEPRRVKCGAPDFIVSKGENVVGHLEAKDLTVPIRAMKESNKAQQERYRAALPNLIYSNGLDWDFYRDGDLIASVAIASLGKAVQPKPDQYAALENLLRDFIKQRPQIISSPRDLAERMAGKANLIKDVLSQTLNDDPELRTELSEQYKAFKENLIHDITPGDFADIYAETIAYGMFAARLHDTTPGTFSRREALELLPKSNPFLRALFSYVAGNDLDDRIAWIIDDLADVFQASDMGKIMEGFGRLTGQQDPFLHFYETFLAAYNPAKRKARGVWYTPEPVVNFIVRAVDQVLQTEFGLPEGLADTSKVTVDWDTGQTNNKGKAIKIKKQVHRVQILDPATGTGTFLAEVIKQIAPRVQRVAPGMWAQYVENDLIPRLHGFELLMASYAMCHMKLDMILTELGYRPTGNPPRLSVYLTNSLEEGEPANQTLPFSQWLSREAKGANTIKRDMPIMCVIGNPPYNPSSKNSNPWIDGMMRAYRKGVSDKKINLNDDYMKFIRMAEDLVSRNEQGIVAMITNNSFLDGTTQRGMRAHLKDTFDRISIINLHGDIRDQQADHSDENIFDITQGVSIILLRKTGSTGTHCSVRYSEITGKRAHKQQWLDSQQLLTTMGNNVEATQPYFFFKPFARNISSSDFGLEDFFEVKSSGIQTKNDDVAVAWTAEQRDRTLSNFLELSPSELQALYPPKKVWDTMDARTELMSGKFECRTITYRVFDIRYTIFTKKSGGFLGRPRYDVMQHIGAGDISLVINKKHVGNSFSHVSVAKSLVAHGVHYLGNRGQDFACPLYLGIDGIDQERRVNFSQKLYSKLQTLATHSSLGTPDELTVFDYVYGVLHYPQYRSVYAESLKIGFPRIPWPANPDEFWNVSAKGTALRKLHLMDAAAVGDTPYPFTGTGDNVVDKPAYKDGKVWINKTQFFDNAPKISWGFYIGGYQPAQKWLKDRKGRALNFEDVKHYQRILKVLSETDRIMKTITMTLAAPSGG